LSSSSSSSSFLCVSTKSRSRSFLEHHSSQRDFYITAGCRMGWESIVFTISLVNLSGYIHPSLAQQHALVSRIADGGESHGTFIDRMTESMNESMNESINQTYPHIVPYSFFHGSSLLWLLLERSCCCFCSSRLRWCRSYRKTAKPKKS